MPDAMPREEPPAARRGFTRRAALIAAGVALAAVVAVIAWSARYGRPAPTAPQVPPETIELTPGPLAKEAPTTLRLDRRTEGGMPELAEGGRIQNTDEDGNLAQEYRFRRLDPNPPGKPANWVRMEEPQAEIYLGDDRVLSLSGDEALTHLPARVLESGTITGNVTIRLFEPPPGRVLDPARDEPLMEVRTDEATFDNVIGEVRVPGAFHVETATLEFPGRGFTMLINDQTERVLLTVEVEEVGFLRLARTPQPSARAAAAGDEDVAAAPAPARPRPDRQGATERRRGRARRTPDAEGAQFYRLTLHDQIEIRQGPESAQRTATGDALTIVFSSETEGLGSTLVYVPARSRPASLAGRSGLTPRTALARRTALAFLAVPELSIVPAPRDEDIIVTCAGGLTLVPVTDPAQRLESPRDARLTLTGRPVTLRDAAQDARAECDRLVYGALEQKVELVGSASQPLVITAPRLAAGGETFWIRKDQGGFTGPGWLETYEPTDADGPARRPQLNLTWNDRVDLDFHDPDNPGAPGDLRQAAFRGEVTATDAQRTVWADGLDVTFARDAAGPGGDLEQVTADGDIQILLDNGARVFADRLTGDPARETVELTGANLAIAHGRWLIDQGRRLVLDQQAQTADWPGPGVARRLAMAVGSSAAERVPRPRTTGAPEARLDWAGSLRFDEAAGDGAGAIDLYGGVTAVSEPSPLERSTFAAREVTVHLASDDDTASASDAADTAGRLGRIFARGDARLERRLWDRADRADEPRILYLSGPRLEFDDRSGDGLVDGAGALLVHDPRPPADDVEASSPALGARGTTAFRWQRRLELTRRDGTRYDITMLDGIEMRHLGPDRQPATLTCARIEATIDQAQTAGDAPAADPLGGSGELHRLRAEGSVFLHTPQRDVDCDVFDYDVTSGLAELWAHPGQHVAIVTAGTPQPVRVERATWDLHRDELTVLRGTGGAIR